MSLEKMGTFQKRKELSLSSKTTMNFRVYNSLTSESWYGGVLKKEIPIGNHHFWELCENFGGYNCSRIHPHLHFVNDTDIGFILFQCGVSDRMVAIRITL